MQNLLTIISSNILLSPFSPLFWLFKQVYVLLDIIPGLSDHCFYNYFFLLSFFVFFFLSVFHFSYFLLLSLQVHQALFCGVCCCCWVASVVSDSVQPHQAPPSLGFSRQEHWSGLPFPSPAYESEKWRWSCSVVSPLLATSWTAAYQAPPWDFPGKSSGVGCHCLLPVCV